MFSAKVDTDRWNISDISTTSTFLSENDSFPQLIKSEYNFLNNMHMFVH